MYYLLHYRSHIISSVISELLSPFSTSFWVTGGIVYPNVNDQLIKDSRSTVETNSLYTSYLIDRVLKGYKVTAESQLYWSALLSSWWIRKPPLCAWGCKSNLWICADGDRTLCSRGVKRAAYARATQRTQCRSHLMISLTTESLYLSLPLCLLFSFLLPPLSTALRTTRGQSIPLLTNWQVVRSFPSRKSNTTNQGFDFFLRVVPCFLAFLWFPSPSSKKNYCSPILFSMQSPLERFEKLHFHFTFLHSRRLFG